MIAGGFTVSMSVYTLLQWLALKSYLGFVLLLEDVVRR